MIREGKNSIITFVALCRRAAISGGLSPAVSYDLCDFYTEMAESCKTISELALISGYSEYYLSRKFKKETGIPPHEFINHEKAEYTKLLLFIGISRAYGYIPQRIS